jgi:peptidoglycan hydrolase-like protein with peptidoglycan-binding domain
MTATSHSRSHNHIRPIALLAAAAVAGAVVAISLHAGAVSAPAAQSQPPLSTATIVRTDLRTSTLTGGTLGYASARPLTNQLRGTYTWLPATGVTVARGRPLYRVDNLPVVLMKGVVPAWRALARGMTDGPDVTELQSNLIALGYADGLLYQPTGHFDSLTAAAVRRWQAAWHEPLTGKVALGQIAFLPSSVRTGARNVAAGQAAAPGQQPYQVTGAVRTVSVPLNPNLPTTSVGERVSIILPSGASIPGRVSTIGPPPPAALGGSSGSGTRSGSDQLTVIPLRPTHVYGETSVPVQVSLTTSSVRHSLAAPVAALLALAGGGYGVEVVEPSGAHRLLGVRTGVFAGNLVQLSGLGIRRGTRVVVAQ